MPRNLKAKHASRHKLTRRACDLMSRICYGHNWTKWTTFYLRRGTLCHWLMNHLLILPLVTQPTKLPTAASKFHLSNDQFSGHPRLCFQAGGYLTVSFLYPVTLISETWYDLSTLFSFVSMWNWKKKHFGLLYGICQLHPTESLLNSV
jgi:hypothetical protein